MNLKKIKTIYIVHYSSEDTIVFDNQVNEYLDNEWILAEIRIIEAQAPNVHDVYYARLEKWGY